MLRKKFIYKTITTFISAAVVLMIIFELATLFCIANNYETKFLNDAAQAVQNGFAENLKALMNTSKREFIKQYELKNMILSYSSDLGLSNDRKCYILSAPSGSVIAPDSASPEVFEKTSNLSNALDRKTIGNDKTYKKDYVDFAYYVKPQNETTTDGFVIYIRDNKSALRSVIHQHLWIFLWIFLAGLAVSVIAAVTVSKSVTVPLRKLSRRADSFARGVYDLPSDTSREDEIGSLISAFNHMGSVMSRSISQISAEKHKVDVIMEHITNGIMAFDTNQNLIHINPAAKELFDINDEETPVFDEFFKELGAGVCMAEFLYLDKYATEIRDITMDGSRHIRIYFVPFKMDNDRTAGVVCVFEDFTEQFNLEVARREFVAEVSHELKTPLFIIKTHTETLLNGYMDDKKMAKKFLTTIETEADKMTALVRNLLDLSKFDVQKFEMKKEVFSIDNMLRGIVSRFALEAEIEDIELQYIPVNELPQMYADPEQIERAIVNIVSNAIKYGERGGHVNVAAGSMYNEVYIKVEDDGHGIPKADLEHVFDRFFRVDRARTREKGGTGLGLSIAKEIIESHGGSIVIESEYGKFTRVTINLPTANVN